MYTGIGGYGFSGDGGPATAATFGYPERVMVDSTGIVYVSDSGMDLSILL